MSGRIEWGAGTPGPFHFNPDTNEVLAPSGRTVCRAHRDAPTRPEAETQANGRMFTEGPAMVELLRRVANGGGWQVDARAILARIDAEPQP